MNRCWRIICSLLPLLATLFGVVYLKSIGVDKTDIFFASGVGIFGTVVTMIRLWGNSQ